MEEKLIQDARQGNQEAMARLLQNNYEFVFKYLIKFTLDRSMAEDITQDTMLRAIEKLEKYDIGKAKFSTWLITIAQNIYLDKIRKSKTQQKHIDSGDINECLFGQMDSYDDTWNRLLEVMKKLTEDVRVPIVLKHYYGYAYDEIAKKMKIPIGTVKSRIHNGLKLLKKELE
jgi:RNA polymerase sigma-70 factor (ECF subfamily)